MSLPEIISFDKEGNPEKSAGWRTMIKRFFLALVIILVALLSFGIGRLTSTGDRTGVSIEYDPQLTTNDRQPTRNTTQAASANASASQVVVSKNGSKYHYSHCPGAKQINEENKIYFNTAAAAEASGYTLAGNCTPR